MQTLCVLLIVFFSSSLYGIEFSYPLYNSNEGCETKPKILLIDNNSNNKFEYLIYSGCKEKAKVLKLEDNSSAIPGDNLKAILINGNINSNNFTIYLMDSLKIQYTHKLYCLGYEPVIMEDYTENTNDQNTLESADKYFLTQRIGNLIILTKIAEINVYSIALYTLQGVELFQRTVHNSESSYYVDFTGNPVGVYLFRFIVYVEETMQYQSFVKKIVFFNSSN